MRIGELADAAGMTTKALRFYEKRGLLPAPARTTSGYRDYDPDTVERLAFIRDAQLAGLTLAEIASVLEMKDSGSGTCEHTASLLRRHLDELDGRIAALGETRRRLRELADRASGLDPADCRDPHRCQVIGTVR
ncbi:MAG: heavy metal-responsive transcriptional regulator [Acidimicrobiales bacterium]